MTIDPMQAAAESPPYAQQRLYSLHKCRSLFNEGVLRYKKLKKKLGKENIIALENILDSLNDLIHLKNQQEASKKAHELEEYLKDKGRKSGLEHLKEFVIAFVLAICIAAFVRQVWFELYEIPTGSMRPTFKEQDSVFVSKNAFGINTPFQTSHLNFDPSLLQRGNIIVFSGDGVDLPDVDTTYFWLFPGKRRYVKRCMGKPGDHLYFYGGKLYGIDKEGRELHELLDDPSYSSIEHIPFTTFEGRVEQKRSHASHEQEIIFKQMNLPIGKLTVSPTGKLQSYIYNGKEWVAEQLKNKEGTEPTSYADYWGIKNFALARLITPKELPKRAKELGYFDPNAKLYLELKHTPSITARMSDKYETSLLTTHTTWIGLDQEAIDRLKSSLYTSRFVVKNGIAFRYAHDERYNEQDGISVSKEIPEGTYEFFSGKAYKIGLGGYAQELDITHPMYPKTREQIKTLFNSGIELSKITDPNPEFGSKRNAVFPTRFAYFRDGSFIVMGEPLFASSAEKIKQFNMQEQMRAQQNGNYPPFKDYGAPVNPDGSFNKEFITNFGVTITPGHYLGLGDNHAMSSDSRYFGFIDENNIQGSPAFIFWPPGNRFGPPPQPNISFLRIQNAYTWGLFLIVTFLSFYIYYRKSSEKRYKKLKSENN